MQPLTFSSANPCLDKNNKRCIHSKCSECHLQTFPIVESSTSTSKWFFERFQIDRAEPEKDRAALEKDRAALEINRAALELKASLARQENLFLQTFSDSGVGGVGSRLRFTPTGDISKVTGDAVRSEIPNESTSEIWEDKEASEATSGRLDMADSGE